MGIVAFRSRSACSEQRGLQRAVVGQGVDRRGPQGEDPVEPVRLEILADPRLPDHAAVSDEHHALQPEAVAELADLRGHGGRIDRVPRERLYRHGPTPAVAKHPELDLRQPPLAVAGVFMRRQRAGPAIAPDRGQIVKNRASLAQMLFGQRLLDPRLALEKLVYGLVKPVLADVLWKAELGRERRDVRLRPGAPGDPERVAEAVAGHGSAKDGAGQDRGRRLAVRNGFDKHGYYLSRIIVECKTKNHKISKIHGHVLQAQMRLKSLSRYCLKRIKHDAQLQNRTELPLN